MRRSALATLGVAFLLALAGVVPIGAAHAVVDPCSSPFTPAYSIQGSGGSAAITGAVTTQGVVARYQSYEQTWYFDRYDSECDAMVVKPIAQLAAA